MAGPGRARRACPLALGARGEGDRGHPGTDRGAMTLPTMMRTHSEWAAIGTAGPSRLALLRLAGVEPDVRAVGTHDLAGLVAAVSGRRRRLGAEASARVLSAMVRSGGVDPLVPRAIVQAMLPCILATATALGAGGPWEDLDAVVADAVCMAWEITVRWQGQYRPWAARDLASALRLRLRRERLVWYRRAEQQGIGQSFKAVTYPGEERSALEALASAIASRVGDGLSRPDAVALYGRRVLGLTRAELAERTGETLRQVEYRTKRGERCLVTT